LSPNFTSAAAPIARLIEELNRLPGIGPKSAQRLAYHLLQAPADKTEALAKAITASDILSIFSSIRSNLVSSF